MINRILLTATLALIFFAAFYVYQIPAYTYVKIAPSAWMEEQVERDLKAYEKGISASSFKVLRGLIDQGELRDLYLITLDDKKVMTYPQKLTKRSEMIVNHLQRMLDGGAKLPEVTFVLGNQDAWSYPKKFSATMADSLPPVFVFAAEKTSSYRHNYILFPDDHTLGSHFIGYRKGWIRIYNEIKSMRDEKTWEQRHPQAFWRGLPTDRVEPLTDKPSPRTRLVEISDDFPDLIDAKFTVITYGNNFIKRTFKPLMQMFSIPPFASYGAQLEYKILPCLDGYTSTYPGFLWRLSSGSLVLKQDSVNEQWFYNLLRPYVEYVPVNNDMSNVIEMTRWGLDNPERSKEIIKNARQIVENNLEPQHIDAYIVLLLNKYAEKIIDN